MTILDLAPVIPVVVIDDVDTAVPVARARPRRHRCRRADPTHTGGAGGDRPHRGRRTRDCGGAGTVVDWDQAKLAADAGARFLVSSGVTPGLLDAMADTGLPFLPGCATISEVLAVRERGITEIKFFPAEASGGIAFLASVAGPLPGVRFCATGGISPTNTAEYLALPNVACVGGSWLTPASVLRGGEWARITALAAEAAKLRGAR